MKCKSPNCPYLSRPSDSGYCRTHYNAHLKRRAQRMGYQQGLVDITPVREHIKKLRACGLGIPRIAEMANLDPRNLQDIASGRRSRCQGLTAHNVLSIPVPSVPHKVAKPLANIPAAGTRRRIRALIAIGYTCRYIARRIGSQVGVVSYISLGNTNYTTSEFAERVDKLFVELQMTTPPNSAQAKRSRNRAKALGWSPPLAWDEDSIDNPNAVPFDKLEATSLAERIDDYREIGRTDDEIAEAMGIKVVNLRTMLTRRGIPLGRRYRDVEEHKERFADGPMARRKTALKEKLEGVK